jgi:hypothetical protein
MARMNDQPSTKSRTAARIATLAMAVAALFGNLASAQARPRGVPFVQVQSDLKQLLPAQRGGGVSLAQATAIAQGRFQGRVIRAETMQMGDRVVHEVRILGDDGRVRTVRIDAQTGSFL